MGKEYSDTEHQFDVWHLTKIIKNKLVQKAKTKGCEHLGLWIKAVRNHLWGVQVTVMEIKNLLRKVGYLYAVIL
jgi:hypothetical protein